MRPPRELHKIAGGTWSDDCNGHWIRKLPAHQARRKTLLFHLYLQHVYSTIYIYIHHTYMYVWDYVGMVYVRLFIR